MKTTDFVTALRATAEQLGSTMEDSERAMTRRDVDYAIASAFDALASRIAFEEGTRMIEAGQTLKGME